MPSYEQWETYFTLKCPKKFLNTRGGSRTAAIFKMECFVLEAVNYYHKAPHLGCCSSLDLPLNKEICNVMKRSPDKCFYWLINSSVKLSLTISLFPVKVKISSLLIHRTNPRHDTLDLTQSKKSKYCFICQRFWKQRCF